MLLFGVVAVVLPAGSSTRRYWMRQKLCALMLFSPWFFVLDVMCSMTIWAAVGSCIPEPNSMWIWDPAYAKDAIRMWLIRLIVPVPLVGTLFLFAVLRWRWWTALLASLLLIPPAAVLWLIWDRWFAASWVMELVQW
jgi:hypothetical protein